MSAERQSAEIDALCVCGKPVSLHFDSRETRLPPGAVLSHPPRVTPPAVGDDR